jgi:hypothetical protein
VVVVAFELVRVEQPPLEVRVEQPPLEENVFDPLGRAGRGVGGRGGGACRPVGRVSAAHADGRAALPFGLGVRAPSAGLGADARRLWKRLAALLLPLVRTAHGSMVAAATAAPCVARRRVTPCPGPRARGPWAPG